MPDGWTFVIATTGVTARKAGEVRDDYNRAAALTSAIVDAYRQYHPADHRSLGQLARDARIANLLLPPDLRARLDHFLCEDACVVEAADAFERGDILRIRALADESQSAATTLLRNQLPETLDLVADARAEGADAACGFGAGWGGSVWALVPEDESEAFLERWLLTYEKRHPQLSPEGFISPPTDGITRL
jgi:galactokinase